MRRRMARVGPLTQRFSLSDGQVAVQVALGLGVLGIGLRLLAEGDTFRISASYEWFRGAVREHVAGWVMVAAGLVTLVAPALRSRLVDVATAFLLGSLCGVIAIGFHLGSARSIGTTTFLSPFAFLAYWLMFKRLGR